MRKTISDRNVWPRKESRTILGAYLEPLLVLGYGEAGDALQDLLKLTDEQIRDAVAASISGKVEDSEVKGGEPQGGEDTATPLAPVIEVETKEEVPPVVMHEPPKEAVDTEQITPEQEEVVWDIFATQIEEGGASLGGIPQAPLTPHIEKPPEETSSEATPPASVVQQSNSKNSNITDFFRPTPAND